MAPVRPSLKIALAGLALWFGGFALGGVANSNDAFLWMTVPGDILTSLGTVLAVAGAVWAGSSPLQIIPVGIVLGLGIFYVGELHETHDASGLGFGLDHITHIFIGLGLWAAATVLAAFLAFYHTRKARAPQPEPYRPNPFRAPGAMPILRDDAAPREQPLSYEAPTAGGSEEDHGSG